MGRRGKQEGVVAPDSVVTDLLVVLRDIRSG